MSEHSWSLRTRRGRNTDKRCELLCIRICVQKEGIIQDIGGMNMRKLKSILVTVCMLMITLLANNATALAASGEATESLGDTLSLAYCIPFVGMLLSIAIVPLFMGKWWEKNKQYAVILWSLLLLIPFAIFKGADVALEELLEVIFGDYITFIVLLFGLFCVAGNIRLGGKIAGKPVTNVVMLLIGTLLSSWIGTTGASMVMIRPLIRANKWRKRKVQVVVFFIFLVSNIGGCLTPVGDPPLLMGFVNGVGFAWSFHLLPVLIINVILLLIMFFALDNHAYKQDLKEGLKPPKKKESDKIFFVGKHNVLFLIMIVGAVVLSGVLPKEVPFFAGAIKIYKGVEMGYAAILEVVIILTAAFLSFKTTVKDIRDKNHFTWDAIVEVAVLFIGIFITMVPALLILKAKGASLGVNEPWQFFWIAGLLSSFLDNTPTYLVFFTTAAASGIKMGHEIQTALGAIPQTILMAISCGAVFMGAITYIGNAPNFMVCSIAEENGIRMPSFFGYMKWSICCLIPVFLIDMLIFFL